MSQRRASGTRLAVEVDANLEGIVDRLPYRAAADPVFILGVTLSRICSTSATMRSMSPLMVGMSFTWPQGMKPISSSPPTRASLILANQHSEGAMRTTGNTILITGGATGIGFALARALLQAGNEVVICGRRKDRLDEAKRMLPKVHTVRCDVADAAERSALFEWITGSFPTLNILVNNAGIQKQIDLKKGTEGLVGSEDEIETNLRAPVHLSALFIPHLMKQPIGAIVNVSSGLAFIPIAFMPLYCATKAAIHSFSLSLRHQLRGTAVKVFEVIPPTVDTELDKGARGRRGQEDRGIKPEEVALATLRALAADEFELAVGQAQSLRAGARREPERFFQMLNGD